VDAATGLSHILEMSCHQRIAAERMPGKGRMRRRQCHDTRPKRSSCARPMTRGWIPDLRSITALENPTYHFDVECKRLRGTVRLDEARTKLQRCRECKTPRPKK
jgi:hypothetical protein